MLWEIERNAELRTINENRMHDESAITNQTADHSNSQLINMQSYDLNDSVNIDLLRNTQVNRILNEKKTVFRTITF